MAGRAEGVDAVISIRASNASAEPALAVALAQATRGESARLLKLCFDDIGIDNYGNLIGPTMMQVADAIEFGRRVADGTGLFDGPNDKSPVIAVHCEYGKSRSAAIALALLADHAGDGRELDAVAALLRDDLENKLHPNPLIVSLIDDCLFRYGRIDAALVELCPTYNQWRRLWRHIAENPQVDWRKARRAIFREAPR